MSSFSVSTDRGDLQPITPRQAFDQWMEHIRADTSGSTSSSYRRRVKKFIAWCESEGILNLNTVNGRDIKQYRDIRYPALSQSSLKNELRTIRQFLEYGVVIEAVEPALTEKLTYHIPSLSKGEESSDVSIDRTRASSILEYFDDMKTATRDHTLFILMWDTGARISGIRALDVDDFDPEKGTVEFLNRDSADTGLKNGVNGERRNVLNKRTVETIQKYFGNHRKERTDDYGRTPLFTTKFGRISTSTVRRTMYEVTQPCYRSGCPHGEDVQTCQYREHGHQSKCPSSLSPHPIRTGRITDLRNQGVRIAHVAGRVDALPATIRTYYDKPNLEQDLARRRDSISDAKL